MGRLHAFESLEEQRLLLALDFLGVCEVLPQPFRLAFETAAGQGRHTPDFLAVFADGSRWLFDVRPGALVGDEDEVRFTAADEAALSCGWRYPVVTGWSRNVLSVLDALSAQRRQLEDPLGLQGALLARAALGSLPFGDMVARTVVPAVARAHAVHLLWHRRLGLELGRALGDATVIWLAQVGRAASSTGSCRKPSTRGRSRASRTPSTTSTAARSGSGAGIGPAAARVSGVLHPAFTLALATYCADEEKPHLGFVVLDSPVVTDFYRDLLQFPGQVVVVENGDPLGHRTWRQPS